MLSLVKEYFLNNFALWMMALCFVVLISGKKKLGDDKIPVFYGLVFLTLVSDFAAALLDLYPFDAESRTLHILFYVIIKIIRPLGVYLYVLILKTTVKDRWLLSVPAFINAVLVLTAFRTGIVFSCDDSGVLVKGPLYIVPLVTAVFYASAIVYFILKKYRNGSFNQVLLLLVCGLCELAAVLMEACCNSNQGIYVTFFIMTVYYVYVNFYDTDIDKLTGLRTRNCFYEDCDAWNKKIVAVASLDMNGLKHVNDKKGHRDGDDALRAIGLAVSAHVEPNYLTAYRLGGDEFEIIFRKRFRNDLNENLEQYIVLILDKINTDLASSGISIASGYCISDSMSVDEMIKQADQNMYNCKAEYYSKKEHNRRK